MTEDKRFWNIRPESRRIAHPQKIYLKFPNSDEFIEEYLVDLSMTGMFVRCMNPPDAGSNFSFKMRLSAGASTVQGTAEVIWVRQDQHRLSHPKGMGVRFVHLEPDSRRQIQETIERYAQDSGEPQEIKHLRTVVEETLGEVLSPSTDLDDTKVELPSNPNTTVKVGTKAFAGDARYGAASGGSDRSQRSRWIVVAAVLGIGAILGSYSFWTKQQTSNERAAVAEQSDVPVVPQGLPESQASPEPGVEAGEESIDDLPGSEVSVVNPIETTEAPDRVTSSLPPTSGEVTGQEPGQQAVVATGGGGSEEIPEPIKVAEDPEKVLLKVVDDWAAAWSSQDVDAYLSFYSDRFRPGRGLSLGQWREQRRDRLGRPKFVSVQVDDPEVSTQGNGSMRVRFVQTYKSDTLGDTVWKILELGREGESWKILRERVDS